MQGHLFNGHLEATDDTLYDYLMKDGLEIISFRMANKLIQLWNSQCIDWHIERGLKVNIDASQC